MTASDEVISGGPAPAISVFDYAGTGQRLWAGNTGWIAGTEESSRHIEFAMTPVAGNSLTVTTISFEYGAAGTSNLIKSNARYSTDNGTTWTLLNQTPLDYQNPSLAFAQFTVNETVTGPFLLRILPWAVTNSVAMNPSFATHNTVRIGGTTSPADACVLLCNVDFEEFATPVTTFGQLDQNSVSCWSTTASDGKIEIWKDGFGGISAFSGGYFAEINATQTATLFQTFEAVAGQDVVIAFAHRGRYTNPDIMTVTVGPNALGGYDNLGTFSDNASAWGYYSIPYTLPITGSMELRFNSVSSDGGANPSGGAGGNFLDAVSIGCPGGICGIKFNDLDGNGEQGEEEPFLPDWTFDLSGDATGTAVTNSVGEFCFTNLAPGTYTVAEVNPGGWTQTVPVDPNTYTVAVSSGTTTDNLVFGNQAVVPTITLSGLKFNDVNGNGVNDGAGEEWHAGLPQVTILATVPFATNATASALTDPNGNFSMTVPDGSVYWITEESVTGYSQTFPTSASNGRYQVGTSVMNLNFGNQAIPLGSICGKKFNDIDGNGIQEGLELALSGWTINLTYATAAGLVSLSDVTDENGAYCFNDLAAGSYTVSETNQDGWEQILPPAPGTYSVELEAGEDRGGILFGNRLAPVMLTLSGLKFNDANGNGVNDGAGEEWHAGLPQVTILATVPFATTATASALTDPNGAFSMTVPDGSVYWITEEPVAGYSQTFPTSANNSRYQVSTSVTNLNFGNQADVVVAECVAPPKGMVGWWSGDGNASDYSDFGNPGILQGRAGFMPGYVDDSFNFQSVDDFVRVPDAPELNFGPGQDFSMDFWIKGSDLASWSNAGFTDAPTILHKLSWTTSSSNGWIARIIFGHVHFQMTSGGFSVTKNSIHQIDDGNWHFIAISVDRSGGAVGGRITVDNHPPEFFDVSLVQGSLANTSDLAIGQQIAPTGPNNVLRAFGGQIDEVELFARALSDAEISDLYAAGQEGKCKDGQGGSCDETNTVLPLNTGRNHATGGLYAVGGNDAFWTITADADTSRTTPRPAEVITHVPGIWPAALGNSTWIGPSQVDLAPLEQDNVGLGTYTYALELCIVGETATELTFNLLVQADNSASVWLRKPDGTRIAVGTTPVSGFSTPTSMVTTLTGTFPLGTYTLEVDVHNNGISPDFTGMNLTGVVTGANLFLQKHECCNSSGKVTGTKYEDVNGNGEWDDGELPLSGVIIELVQGTTVVGTTTTDGAGDYFFDVPPGTYTVREILPIGYLATAPAATGYPITLGPGEIVPNLDFFNQLIPCMEVTSAFKCRRPTGGRYIELTVTNNGAVAASGVVVASTTPGVSFTVTNSPVFPLAVGGSVVLNLSYTGLALGASAQLHVSLYGMPDGAGVTEACCQTTVTVTRPTRESKFDCPFFIDGDVIFKDADAVSTLDILIVRARERDGTAWTTMTDDMGGFLFESLPAGDYTLSLDLPFHLRIVNPESGFHLLSLKEGQAGFEGARFTVSSSTVLGVDPTDTSLPTDYTLETNYPNPFNPSTVIRYATPASGAVQLVVYDMLGRPIATLVDQVQAPGRYAVTFDAATLPSGMYLYRITAGSFVQTKTMMLLR